MIDREIIAYLRLVHGSYNALIMLLFIYQGLMGLKIRRNRIKGRQQSNIIKRHRRLGPILAILGISGFFVGLSLVYLDAGDLLKYPLHLLNGLALSSSIMATFLISRKIRGLDSPWRTLHFRLGILILFLYFIQLFLGLSILL